MYREEDKHGKIGIIITIIVLIFLVVITNLNDNFWSHIVNPLTKTTRCIQNGFSYLKNKISEDDEYFTSLEELKKQNKDLIEQNENLKMENQNLEVLKAENKTLKEYVKITEKYSDYNTIPGYVTQRDFSNYSKTLVINLGSKDGIERGMTVVSEKGLVGHIVSVEDNSSKVLTIIDTASAVSGFISNTDKSLVARGVLDKNNLIKGTYIDNDVVINEEDYITTSGLGGIYPPNIIIGRVKKIENTKNKTNRYAMIETSVDFNNLNSILVIKNKGGTN